MTEIKRLIVWMAEQIDKSPDNVIRIKVIDIKKIVPEFEKMSEADIYQNLKDVLHKYGMSLETSKTKNDESLFIIRSLKEMTMPEEIARPKVEPKIPIVSPTEVESGEKRLFTFMIERIEELELPIGQNVIVFNIMLEGAKFAINQNIEIEDMLTYYYADKRTYYFFGILDALEKYDELSDFIKTYSTSEEEFKLYFDLYIGGVSLMAEIYEKGESVPYIENVIEGIDSMMKEDEILNQRLMWEKIKSYIDKIE